eukprot:481441-Amphidinium_carterae.1
MDKVTIMQFRDVFRILLALRLGTGLVSWRYFIVFKCDFRERSGFRSIPPALIAVVANWSQVDP